LPVNGNHVALAIWTVTGPSFTVAAELKRLRPIRLGLDMSAFDSWIVGAERNAIAPRSIAANAYRQKLKPALMAAYPRSSNLKLRSRPRVDFSFWPG
jgi:hypothetical protein